MIRPNLKTALALVGVGTLVGLGAISGVFAGTSNVLSPTTALAGVVSLLSFIAGALLAWVLFAAQMRRERLTLSRSVQERIDTAAEARSSLIDKIDRLDTGQRKTLNVLRGAATEAREDRDRISGQLEVSRRELVALGGVSAELGRLSARVRKSEQLLDVVESRNRKILNIARAESRSNVDNFAALESDLKSYGANALTAKGAAEDASAATRKMHNFLRRDGSIQIAVDHFIAGERRVLQAIDAAALDHGDSLAALEANVHEGAVSSARTISRLAQLSDSHEALSLNVERHQRDLQRVEHEAQEHTIAHAAVGLEGAGLDLQNSLKRIGAESIAGSRQVARTMADRVQRGANRQSIEVVRQVEALLQLIPRVDTFEKRFPPSGWWALPADTLLQISDYVGSSRPKRILEIGSGASTVWIGTFAEQIGSELVSLEHDAEFVQKSKSMVEQYGLSSTATVHYAPLKPVEIEGKKYEWYDSEVVSKLEGPFDMLIVDGPPESTGEMARFPALPLTKHLLSETCLIVLDDTHRSDEKEILKSWVEMNEGFEVAVDDLMRSSMLMRKRGHGKKNS